jgi:surfactin synthase thioesterase subunit
VSGEASAPTTLYIFPHAGASDDFYVPFARAFSTGIKRVAVQYPRRRGQHDLPPMTNIAGLSDDIYQMLAATDESADDVTFFAHSMGAIFAFEVARRFESAGTPIAALFVSASVAPSRMQHEHLPESDSELLDTVTDMMGLNPEFTGNEQFASTVLPTLRSLSAIANYDCPVGVTVSCPIYAFVGDNDPIATSENVLAWSEHTSSDFAVRIFSGGHHYINDNLPELVSDIETKISLCR